MFLRRAAANLGKLRKFSATSTVSSLPKKPTNSIPLEGNECILRENGFGDYSWSRNHTNTFQWILLSGQAAILLGINASPALAEDVSIGLNSTNTSEGGTTSLRKIEDGSFVSNIHTSKWRVFTDNGRDFFLEGKLEEAEKLFVSAVQEAKEGFGVRDPHVASACNNLAELYRIKKEFDKAELLYLEAINILEEAFGQDDIRVGAALHNLAQSYLIQRKLDQAHACYERALKIKRRVLGEENPDYAATMYHLGTVLYLEGNEKDAEALIMDSIRILEEGGLRESMTCLRWLQYLAQIYIKSNRIAEAENIQRKILHIMELSKSDQDGKTDQSLTTSGGHQGCYQSHDTKYKMLTGKNDLIVKLDLDEPIEKDIVADAGWKSLDTVIAAERLALTIQSTGSLREAEELLERCLDARKTLLPQGHIQNAANMLYIARVKMLTSNQLRKTDISQAMAELDKAKDFLNNSIRVAQQILAQLLKQRDQQSQGDLRKSGRNEHSAILILLQSLNALGLLEITKLELRESRDDHLPVNEAENFLHQCISAFKEFGSEILSSNSPEVKAEYRSCLKHLFALVKESNSPKVKAEYLSCLKHVFALVIESKTASLHRPMMAFLEELKAEIKRVEAENSSARSRS